MVWITQMLEVFGQQPSESLLGIPICVIYILPKINSPTQSAPGRLQPNRSARFGEVDTLDLQHRLGERAMLGRGHGLGQGLGLLALPISLC